MGNSVDKRNSGFTLLELMVAIMIVGIMLSVVAVKSDDWFGRNMKASAVKLGSTIRYLHDKASTENLYMRLVFDIEKNSYWVEATTEPFLLTTKEVEEADKTEIEKEKAAEAKNKVQGTGSEVQGEEGKTAEAAPAAEEEQKAGVKKYRTPDFGAIDERLLKSIVLPDGIFIKDIYTSHDKLPIGGGQAFIYFFPNGYVEPAIINLRDEEDKEYYSISTSPILGSAKVLAEYKSLEHSK